MITQRLSRARLLTATMAVAALALTAGCAPGANTTRAATGTPPGKVQTDASKLGKVTLTVWDQEVRGGQKTEIEALNKSFHEKYPNITIKRNSQSFDDLAKTLRLALSGPDAPDVVESNNSRSQMGAFVGAKQIVSLEPYAKVYGWRNRFPESVTKLSSYSADAKTFGSGDIYGLPQMGEIVGVYYNRKKLAALGLTVPKTWAEFNRQLATIKAGGETPLTLGDLEKWPAIHIIGPIQGAHTPAKEVQALAMGNAGGDWTDATNTAAATELRDWVKAGYFNKDVNGSKYDDMVAKFGAGTGVYLIAGSWNTATLEPVMAGNLGFFAPPPVTAGDAASTTGGTSLPFTITSASKHPDAAAAYVNFLTSDDAMKVIAKAGNLPVLHSAELAPASGGGKDVYAAYETVTGKGNLLPYLDYATPTFSDTLGAALQDLIAGKQTPEQFTKTLQADYGKFVSK
jgi:raffinose/stachyose/melibiose transport system substrate-binding protein